MQPLLSVVRSPAMDAGLRRPPRWEAPLQRRLSRFAGSREKNVLHSAGDARRWSRKLLPGGMFAATLALWILSLFATHYILLGSWAGHTASERSPAATQYQWDDGSECLQGPANAQLKPGWVCVKRQRLEKRPTVEPNELLEKYFIRGIPVILTDLPVKQWPALRNNTWSLEMLRRRYGGNTVSVQVGRAHDPDYVRNGDRLSVRIRFSELVRKLELDQKRTGSSSDGTNDYYVTANNFLFRQPRMASLLRDVQPHYEGFMEPLLYDQGYSDDDPSAGTDIWMGPKGTVSPLHQDATSLLFTQVTGRKLWRLISPDQRHLIYAKDGLSDVDLDMPWDDLVASFPSMREASVLTEVLEPGETLFLPNGWWHHVTSLDNPTISVSCSRWLPMFTAAEERLHKLWSDYPWEVHVQG